MSKKLMYFAVALLTVVGVSTVTGCKKGENDPFLSLRSRKARVTGEWKLKEGVVTNTNNFSGSTSSSTTTYTETTRTSGGFSVSYSETLTMEKDGTFTVSTIEDGEVSTVKGDWFFAGSIKEQDLKNKEAIVLSAQEYSEAGYVETYDGLYYGSVLMIDQLKNKEIIFKGETSYNSGSFSGSSSYDRTFEKQ